MTTDIRDQKPEPMRRYGRNYTHIFVDEFTDPLPPTVQRMLVEPKPMPAGKTRLVPACVCGRRIPQSELIALDVQPRCPDCNDTLRIWVPIRVGCWARIKAWWQLRQWKKRRAHASSRSK